MKKIIRVLQIDRRVLFILFNDLFLINKRGIKYRDAC